MARKKGAKKAQSELMKMLTDKDSYSKSLKKNVAKQKKLVEEDKKMFPKSKAKSPKTSFAQELGEVGPELKRGVKREFKKIKEMFKKDK